MRAIGPSMTFARLLIVVAVLGFGVHWWNERSERQAIESVRDEYGFLPVPMPSGAARNTVLIFTPLNCPREGAQRAHALSQKLTELAIPHVKTSHYAAQSFEPSEEQFAAFKRLNLVMTGEIPITLINGMGKANPSIDEVIAEYRKSQ